MEKIEYRAVIRFFVLKVLKAKKIYEELLEVYKELLPLKSTVEFWTEDDPHQKSLSKFIILLVKIQV